MGLLGDFLSRDPDRIWSASCAVRTLRDPDLLATLAADRARIRKATRGVPLGGGFMLNSTHLDFALAKLTFVAAGNGCLCELYPKDLLFNPVEEEAAGNVRVVSTAVHEGGYGGVHRCACTVCGSEYDVEEGEYHYTWWQWRRARRPQAR